MQAFFSEQELRRFFTDNKIVPDGKETSGDGVNDDFCPGDGSVKSPHTDLIPCRELREISELEKQATDTKPEEVV